MHEPFSVTVPRGSLLDALYDLATLGHKILATRRRPDGRGWEVEVVYAPRRNFFTRLI